jgi:steroid delta-isomerase-like uncharacterized protein
MTATMTLTAIQERITSLFDAYNAHDVDAIMALCTDDVVWEDPALPVTAVGRGAVTEVLREQFKLFPDLAFPKEEIELYRSFDHHGAAARWRMSATLADDVDILGAETTGRRTQIPGMSSYEFQDGLICRVTVFYDVLSLSVDLGLMASLPEIPARLFSGAHDLFIRANRIGHRLLGHRAG